jgi:hypothetical protein
MRIDEHEYPEEIQEVDERPNNNFHDCACHSLAGD